MDTILEGQTLINGVDIWKEYGVFLTEEKKGGKENLNPILAPAKTKSHVSVNIREHAGRKYPAKLVPASDERDVTLHFAQYAATRSLWLARYTGFISFLKQGADGWLDIRFPELDLTLHVFYVDCTPFKSLTYLWKEGVQAGRYKVKFREPVPII